MESLAFIVRTWLSSFRMISATAETPKASITSEKLLNLRMSSPAETDHSQLSLHQVAIVVNTARSDKFATLGGMNAEDRTRKQQGNRLAEARKAAGYRSARAAALENGWPESTYRAHEGGTRTIGQDDAERYAKRFRANGVQVDAQSILFPGADIVFTGAGGNVTAIEAKGIVREDQLTPNVDFSKTEDAPPLHRFGGPRNVPVLGTAVGGGDEDGDFRFNGETIDYAPRPPGIAHKKDVYVLYVENDSMFPKFEPGERLYVDPHRKPRIGDYAVVELYGAEEGAAGKGYIKRLVKQTTTKVVVSQFNPAKELEFDRDQVKSLHRVIPTDELLGV